MKNYKKVFSITAVTLLLTSCQDMDISMPAETNQQVITNVRPKVLKPAQVRKIVQDFLDSEDKTRAGGTREIKDIFPICYSPESSISTRSGILPGHPTDPVPTEALDTILYVANFIEDGGYALIIADESSPEDIMAVMDEGSMTAESMYEALNILTSPPKVYDDFPTEGPGIFTENGEKYINPNTFKYYNEEEGDYLIGNMEDSFAKDEFIGINPNPTTSGNDVDIEDLSIRILCLTYTINRDGLIKKNIDYPVLKREEISWIDDNAGEGPIWEVVSEDIPSDWRTISKSAVLLSDYKSWHQREPFNNFYPQRNKWLIFGHKRKAPAGCYPLAIAKTLSYFKSPSKVGEKNFNWDLINSFDKSNLNNSSASWKRAISELMNQIRIGTNAWCFYQGTFVFPGDARYFLRNHGFTNVSATGYDFTKIKNMIDAGKPVFIHAAPNYDVKNSHAWNIDGYKIKQRDVVRIVKRAGTDIVVKTEYNIDTSYMVHCDFGWGGKNNGYFISGIFKLNSPDNDYDSTYESRENIKYNTNIEITTYNK